MESALWGLLYRQTRPVAGHRLCRLKQYRVLEGLLILQAKKHLSQELRTQANAAHIELCVIDPSRAVAEQGPFDLILQKCRDAGTTPQQQYLFWAPTKAG